VDFLIPDDPVYPLIWHELLGVTDSLVCGGLIARSRELNVVVTAAIATKDWDTNVINKKKVLNREREYACETQ